MLVQGFLVAPSDVSFNNLTTFPLNLKVNGGQFLGVNPANNQFYLSDDYVDCRWEVEFFKKKREDLFSDFPTTYTVEGHKNTITHVLCCRLKHYQSQLYLGFTPTADNPSQLTLSPGSDGVPMQWMIRFPFDMSEADNRLDMAEILGIYLAKKSVSQTVDINFQIVSLNTSNMTDLKAISVSGGTASMQGVPASSKTGYGFTVNYFYNTPYNLVNHYYRADKLGLYWFSSVDPNKLAVTNSRFQIRHVLSGKYLSIKNDGPDNSGRNELVLSNDSMVWKCALGCAKNQPVFSAYPYFISKSGEFFIFFFFPENQPNLIMQHDPNGDSFYCASIFQESAGWAISMNDAQSSGVSRIYRVRFVQLYNHHDANDWNNLNKQPVLTVNKDANGNYKPSAVAPVNISIIDPNAEFDIIFN